MKFVDLPWAVKDTKLFLQGGKMLNKAEKCKMEKYVLSVLVENHAGVLSRVSGLSAYSVPIQSGVGGVTANAAAARRSMRTR